MPFQSEKQRRYLWANEPEIARDWTDTYGSRIKKDDGGIMNPRLVPHTGADLLVKNTATGERPKYQPPGSATKQQSRDYHTPSRPSGHPGGSPHSQNVHQTGAVSQTPGRHRHQRHHTGGDQSNVEANKLNIQKMIESGQGKHGPDHLTHNIPSEKFKRIPGKFSQFAKDHWLLKHTQPWFQKGTDINKRFFIDKVLGSKNFIKDWTEIDTEDELQALYNEWMLGRQEGRTDAYGNPLGGAERQDLGGYMGYPSYAAWLAAQGRGGTTEVAEVVKETPSEFQASLTTGTNTPNYYVGRDPTTSNLAWGQQMGVDPRTMGLTSWAADGGRIGRAYGGIMDTATGRRAYGFGSFFKKIGRAAKKVLKSPIAKIGIGALGAYGLGGGFTGGFSMDALRNRFGVKELLTKKGLGEAWSPWKLGIGAATALPFFMGGQEEDDDDKFDYNAIRDAYADELMRIKAAGQAGTLDPTKFVYYNEGGRVGLSNGGDPLLREEYDKYVFEMKEMGLEPMSFEQFKEQARAGMYAGGQSIPSDYTIEDAMMTTTQDKLGGITDVMKQADLFRSGDVGQFYAAQGGRIGAQEGGLMDLGGMEKDYRNDGGFVPIGGEEKADDVPARLSRNEFVFTADAVRGAGGGDIDKGAEIMENVMKNLEQGGQVSEDTQGLAGAQEMFSVSERLSEVV